MQNRSSSKFQTSRAKGFCGEQIVAKQLEEQGYRIIHRNLRTPYGEVDLVARNSQTLLLCEVKYQLAESSKVRGFDLLGPRQRKRLMGAAKWLWLKHRNENINFKSQLWVVTQRETKVCNLPLLYDNS